MSGIEGWIVAGAAIVITIMIGWLFARRVSNDLAASAVVYMTEDEIVENLVEKISRRSLSVEWWRELAWERLYSLHHSIGQSIRNEYALWHTENPYADSSDPEGDLHPDQISHRIIERVWRHFHPGVDFIIIDDVFAVWTEADRQRLLAWFSDLPGFVPSEEEQRRVNQTWADAAIEDSKRKR